MSEESTQRQYWYNIRTGQVEEGHQSSWTHLMGPYPTREAAQHALELAQQRNESWEDEDREWRDRG